MLDCISYFLFRLSFFFAWFASLGGGGFLRRSAQDQAGLDRWVPLAHRLALSLGVGPLRSKDLTEQKLLRDTFLRFMKVPCPRNPKHGTSLVVGVHFLCLVVSR